jgi:hypothetical protein
MILFGGKIWCFLWSHENGAKYKQSLTYWFTQSPNNQKNDEDNKDDEDDKDNKNDEDYDDDNKHDDEDNKDDKDYEDDNEDFFSHQTKVAGTISSTRRWCLIRGVSVDIKQHLCTLSPLYSQSWVKGV